MNGIFWQATLGIFFIFAMTSLGSAVALFLGDRPISKGFSFIGGISAGIMLASAVWSLILPALGDGENLVEVVIGFGVGLTAFSLLGIFLREDETAGYKRLFIAITAHNVPEGLSVGFAYGAAATGAVTLAAALGLAIGIGVQNFPEGAAVAMPARKIYSRKKSLLLGVLSGAVEPLAGYIGYFVSTSAVFIMPSLMSFAAAAMIFTVFSELCKDISEKPLSGAIGAGAGFLIMMLLDVLLG